MSACLRCLIAPPASVKTEQEKCPSVILQVGSGNLLLYLLRNTHVTKSAFLFLCKTSVSVIETCCSLHACMQLALLLLHSPSPAMIQELTQGYSHAGAHTAGVQLRCCSPYALPRSAASSVPPVGAERSVEQAQNLQAEKLVRPAASSQCHILR